MFKIFTRRVVRGVLPYFMTLSAGFLVLDFLRYSNFMGQDEYFLSLITLIAVMSILALRRGPKTFPEGEGATSKKSIVVSASASRVCGIIPRVVEGCGWKMMDADSQRAYFRALIGRSFWTAYGQIFKITVKEESEDTSKVDVSCESLHSISDYGRNDKMITKFDQELNMFVGPRKQGVGS